MVHQTDLSQDGLLPITWATEVRPNLPQHSCLTQFLPSIITCIKHSHTPIPADTPPPATSPHSGPISLHFLGSS